MRAAETFVVLNQPSQPPTNDYSLEYGCNEDGDGVIRISKDT